MNKIVLNHSHQKLLEQSLDIPDGAIGRISMAVPNFDDGSISFVSDNGTQKQVSTGEIQKDFADLLWKYGFRMQPMECVLDFPPDGIHAKFTLTAHAKWSDD